MFDIAIQKTYKGTFPFSIDVQMQLAKGSFVALFGTSGSGKTSVLRMLSGLLKPDSGHISFNNTTWFSSASQLHKPVQERGIGYVFQQTSLFPNMNVEENLMYATTKQDTIYLEEIIQATAIHSLLHKKVSELSGGQQQRVALARTLLSKPSVLLLDEPFSALDYEARMQLIACLKGLHKTYNLTTLLVSHNIAEVTQLADVVYCMSNGVITKSGTPLEVFASNNIETIKFPAEIIAIANNSMQVLLQNKIITIPFTKRGDFKVGNTIWLTASEFNI